MSGTFTSRRTDVDLSQQVTLSITPTSVVKQMSRVTSNHVVTSYRDGGIYDDEILDTKEDSIRLIKREYRLGYNKEYDSGHPFQVDHQYFKCSHHNFYVNNGITGINRKYARGPLLLTGTGIAGYPSIPAWSNSAEVGNRLMNAARPLQSIASLSQFLIELRAEGLPSLVAQEFAQRLRAVSKRRWTAKDDKWFRKTDLVTTTKNVPVGTFGSEYLNVEFGWKPVVNDLVEVLHAVTAVTSVIRQLNIDSGQVIRRSRGVPTETTASSVELPDRAVLHMNNSGLDIGGLAWESLYIGGPYANGRESRVTKTTQVKTRVWFEGAFMYYLHEGDSLFDKFVRYEQYAQKLLGTRITPSVLYETTPWTWLLDWFADFGALINTASALQYDGSLMRYGYLMRHTRVDDVYTAGDFRFYGGGPGLVSNILSSERKERLQASPFGFGISIGSLNARQIAILGALGLMGAPGRVRSF